MYCSELPSREMMKSPYKHFLSLQQMPYGLVARRAEVGGPLVAALDRVRHRLLLIDGLGRERVRAGREVGMAWSKE